MSKQLHMNDMMTNQALIQAAEFLQSAYAEDAEVMPAVNTRHEGYGILAAANEILANGMKNLKSDMQDALKTLAMDDSSFIGAADSVRATLEEIVQASVNMYEHAMNVSAQLMQSAQLGEAPLLDYIDDMSGDDSEAVEE